MNALPPVFDTLLWICATVTPFAVARLVYLRFRHFLFHPVPWTTLIVVSLVVWTRHSPALYRQELAPLVWLLGPAVVAMALPVWEHRELIIRNARVVASAIIGSLIVGIGTVPLLQHLIGTEMARALAVRSVTLPVALGIAQQARLQEGVVLVIVMLSGMFGMIFGPALLMLMGIRSDQPQAGVALGCASHGLGTSRAIEEGEIGGAVASVCMGLSALTYGVFMPTLLRYIN